MRLDENPSIARLLELLREAGREHDAKNLAAVLGYVALVDKQLAAVGTELCKVHEELAGLQDPGPATQQRMALAGRLEETLQTAQGQLAEVKQGITKWAAEYSGASALDGTPCAPPVADALREVSAGLKAAAADCATTGDTIAAMLATHHSMRWHLRNFGRAIRGHSPLAQALPEGKLSRPSQSFFMDVRGVLAGAAWDANAAFERLAEL